MTTAIPGDILVGGYQLGVALPTIYTDFGVLFLSLQLPAHAIGNENLGTRISAHVQLWYAIVAGNATMLWPCGWNKFRVAT